MPCKLDHLIDALHKNNVHSVRLCLADGYPMGQKTRHSENTALHHAAVLDDPQFLQMMINAGGTSEVNAVNSLLRTPLHVATKEGNAPASLVLVENGADPEAMDRDGLTPKDLAEAAGHKNMCAILDGLLARKAIDSIPMGLSP